MSGSKKLLKAAEAAQKNAYAPYSKFKVGAALLTPNGDIFAGANVENAAYPQGQCAEASAIGAMVNSGNSEIAEILIVGDGEALCTPCGGCRQKIREFAKGDVKIHIASGGNIKATFTLDELLPHSFGPKNLKNQKK